MQRRLYFLLPDVAHARNTVSDLIAAGISGRQVYALAAPGIDLQDLPAATAPQRRDTGAMLEAVLWYGNLALFFGALLALALMLARSVDGYWLLLPASIMLSTFLAGEQFTQRVPDVHLSEFRDALHHGEILLMVDVAVRDVERVEALLHQQHPEAVAGGACWHIHALHV